MLVAGIDSSTQNCKVLICDSETGRIVREGRATHPNGTSVAPEHWWTALREAVAAAGGLTDVAAISIAGQQHGMVALDAVGRVVRDALLWNDTRSAAAAEELRSEFGAELLAERTGLVPVASFTITKLRWLRDHEPQHASRVAAVALPHDWLGWRLAGYGPKDETPHGPVLDALWTDRSDASGSGYWRPADGGYDRDLLVAALGHDAILPRVLDPLERGGITAAFPEAGIPAGIPIAAGAGDNAAGALGVGAVPGEAVISLGTSGTVFGVASQRPLPDPTGTVAGFADASGRWLPLIATLNAARVLDRVSSLLRVDHTELGDLALRAPAGSQGLVLQPFFEGERTPNRPHATATLFGMTLANTTRENMARAAIEGMLCNLAEGLDAIRGQDFDPEAISMIGGAGLNPAVQRIAAEVFGLPLRIPEPAEYVALGAGRQAASMLSGIWRDWTTRTARELPATPEPETRARYRAVLDVTA